MAPEDPVQITKVDATKTGSVVSLSTEIDNRGKSRNLELRWLLGLPGDRRPWERPLFVSKLIPQTVGSGRATFSWSDPVGVPRGEYEVTVVVHEVLANRDPIHTTQRAARNWLIFDVDTSILRQDSPGKVSVTDASITGEVSDGITSLRGNVTLQSRSGVLPVADVTIALVPRKPESEWNNAPPSWQSLPRRSQNGQVTIDDELLVLPGSYQVRLMVALAGEIQDQVILSGVQIDVPNADPSLTRMFLPGAHLPLVLVGFAGSPDWTEGSDPGVVVKIRNLSLQEKQGRLQVHVGTKDDAEPWRQPIQSLGPASVTVPGRTTMEVRVPSRVLELSGPYRLAAYLHQIDSGGTETPGDEAFWSRPVNYYTNQFLVENIRSTVVTGTRLTIEGTVRNHRATPKTGRAIFYLGAVAEREPWRAPVFAPAEWTDLSLAPGESKPIRWEADARVPTGPYTVSVWTQASESPGVYAPNSSTFAPPVNIQNSARILRSQYRAGPQITSESLAASIGKTARLQGTIKVSPNTGAIVSLELLPKSSTPFTTPSVTRRTLIPNEQGTIAADEEFVTIAGTYLIRLIVTVDGKTTDEVILTGIQVEIPNPDPSHTRSFTPGLGVPLVLLGFSGSPEWTEGSDTGVIVRIRNLDPNEKRGRLLVHVGTQDDPAPWRRPVQSLDAVNVTVPGRTTIEVRVPSRILRLPGPYRLAAYLHQFDSAGTETPGDEAFWTRPVNYYTNQFLVENVRAAVTNGTRTTIEATIRNHRTTPKSGRTIFYFGPVADREPWRTPVFAPVEWTDLSLAAGESTQIRWEVDARLPSGPYAISVWTEATDAPNVYKPSSSAFSDPINVLNNTGISRTKHRSGPQINSQSLTASFDKTATLKGEIKVFPNSSAIVFLELLPNSPTPFTTPSVVRRTLTPSSQGLIVTDQNFVVIPGSYLIRLIVTVDGKITDEVVVSGIQIDVPYSDPQQLIP